MTSEMGDDVPLDIGSLKRNTEKERLACLVAEELHAGRFDGIDQVNSSLDEVD